MSIDLIQNYFLPKNFKSKFTNEAFAAEIICMYLKTGDFKEGNALKFEPDYIIDKKGFEITLAAEKNVLKDFYLGKFKSDDIEQDTINIIKNRLENKKQKTYCMKTSLVIISIYPIFSWFENYYGSLVVTTGRRDNLFYEIESLYINTNVFENVFIIVPGYDTDNFLFDILNKTISVFRDVDTPVPSYDFPTIE